MKLTTIGLTSAAIAIGLVGSIAAYRGQVGQDAVAPVSTSPSAATSSAWPDGASNADRSDDEGLSDDEGRSDDEGLSDDDD